MKRILFFAITVLLMTGCEKKAPVNDGTDTPPQTREVTPTSDCNISMILSKKEIGDYSTWRAMPENKKVICVIPNDTTDLVYIDLSRIDNDSDNKIKAAWLKTNGKYILYDQSRIYVRNSHMIDDSLFRVQLLSNITYEEIYNIKRLNGMTPANFEKDKYTKYLEITADTTNIATTKMKFKYVDDFNVKERTAYYSIPHLKSAIGDFDEHKKLEFAVAKIINKVEGTSSIDLVMKIEGTNQYFDVTRWPTKKKK